MKLFALATTPFSFKECRFTELLVTFVVHIILELDAIVETMGTRSSWNLRNPLYEYL